MTVKKRYWAEKEKIFIFVRCSGQRVFSGEESAQNTLPVPIWRNICREPGAKEISFQLVDEEENFLMEGKLPVREDGIFYGSNIRGIILDGSAYPYHLRALDAEENVIAGEVEGVL